MLIPLKELVEKYNVNPKGVLHVGANVGEEAIQYEEQGIKNVVWIEANPDIYQTLVMNVAGLGHKTFNFCAGDENKETVLHIANNGGQSSSVLPLGTHARNHPNVKYTHDIAVPMMRIDTFFSYVPNQSERYDLKDVDFLSMDIQGFELEALKGMGDLLNQFKWVYLEVNKEEVYKGNGLARQVYKYLEPFGFKLIVEKYTRANWGDALLSKV